MNDLINAVRDCLLDSVEVAEAKLRSAFPGQAVSFKINPDGSAIVTVGDRQVEVMTEN